MVRGRQLLEPCVIVDELRGEVADLHQQDAEVVQLVHRWGHLHPYGGSWISRCACGHVSDFYLSPVALLNSRCEAERIAIEAGERAALVGWSHRG